MLSTHLKKLRVDEIVLKFLKVETEENVVEREKGRREKSIFL